MFVFPKREIPKKNPPPDSLSHWQRVLKDPGCEPLVTPAFSSQPTRCQVPMMVGMMVQVVVVKGFTEAMHGTVELENIKTGGARFTIEIPAETSYLKNLKNEILIHKTDK